MYGTKLGINWRALVAYLAGIIPILPGFVGTVENHMAVPSGAIKLYHLDYLVGFTVPFFVCVVICYFFPVPNSPVANCLAGKERLEDDQDVETFEEDRELFFSDNNLRNVVSSHQGGFANSEILVAFEPRNDKIWRNLFQLAFMRA